MPLPYILFDYHKSAGQVPRWIRDLIGEADKKAVAARKEKYPGQMHPEAQRYDYKMFIHYMNEYTVNYNGRYTVINNGGILEFDTKEDAVAFKLRWC